MTEINIDNKIQLLHNSVKAFIEAGKTDAEITGWLNKEGIDDHYAATIIENVRNDFHDKKEFWKHILMGSFMTIGGLLSSYMSYKFAEQAGSGMYIIIWGIVVTGIVTIIRGVILFRK